MDGILLIVDDEKHTREGLAQFFSEKFDVFTASQPLEAFKLMESEKFDVIITDLRMGQQSGLSVIDKALNLPNRPVCIMMTAYGSIETAVEAMKHGAYDFISKPIQLDKLENMVQKALFERKNAPVEVKKVTPIPNMLGNSKAFESIIDQIQRVAPTKATVLITGETGTGKELVAQQLHQLSSRSSKPFVPVHCAALPENLLESELFGHERGAFTGALQRHIGLFEAANHGTLFLDEIGEINPNVQVKLLRFLENKSIERLGGTQTIALDVRLVCATNRNLKKEVEEGRFREDLYYRLNVVEIRLPALRERKVDIPVLLDHYFNFFAQENHLKPPKLTNETRIVLEDYLWPGNIRELRNFSENAVVMHHDSVLQLKDLDPKFLVPMEPFLASKNEKQLLQDALKRTNGNKSEAARILGIPRRSFYRKLEKWNLMDLDAYK